MLIKGFQIFLVLFLWLLLNCVSSEKYKLCVVDGKGGFKRSGRYCPILDKPDSKVQCVLGIDRLDCLRKISKGQADFSIFTPEDLVTASNSEIQVLITNELRYTEKKFEYEVAAVIRDSSTIKTKHDLKEKRFCHPGYGYETDWTKILANYLEAAVIPQSCDTNITVTENRIKASANFFRNACKAGPWVRNPKLDQELKMKYPKLCSICDNPSRCNTEDKYWGRRGSLFCLTDGAGDISWARLDDIRVHFGLDPGNSESTPEGYSFLCPDDTIRPINGSSSCVWVVKPWQVVASRRTIAQEIQEFISSLSSDSPWQAATLSLIETFSLNIKKLEPVESIESFLDKATGFLSANSFSGCHPPRTIKICTTSIIENAKCSWLRESSAVYGIEPDLDCLLANNSTQCMEAVNHGNADLVLVNSDLTHKALKTYNLKSLFFETVNDDSKYLTVAVTKNDKFLKKLEDAKGLKACFPSMDGVAWNTIGYTLRTRNLLDTCDTNQALESFFSGICVQGKEEACDGSLYGGELGALRCLFEEKGDVAFVSRHSIGEFLKSKSGKDKSVQSLHILCEDSAHGCHLSWAPLGQAMVRANSSELWLQDTLDVFLQLDQLFGKGYKSLTTPLQLFGPYNGKANILFHDDTVRLRSVPTVRNLDDMERCYFDLLNEEKDCSSRGNVSRSFSFYGIVCCVVLSFLFSL